MSSKGIDEADNFLKLIKRFIKRGEYPIASMAIKKSEILLTLDQQATLDKYKKDIEEAIAKNKENVREKITQQRASLGKENTKMRNLKKKIAGAASEKVIGQYYKEAQEEIREIKKLGKAQGVSDLEAEIDFLAGWSMKGVNPKKALEIFLNSYKKIKDRTVLAALLLCGMINCYSLMLKQATEISYSNAYKDREKYKRLLDKSIFTISRDFESLDIITNQSISTEEAVVLTNKFAMKYRGKMKR